LLSYPDLVEEYKTQGSWNLVLPVLFILWIVWHTSSLGAFAKLRKAAPWVPERVSFRIEQITCHWDGFSWNL